MNGRGHVVQEVYVNDQLIGEARAWGEVEGIKGILFLGKPGAAQGPRNLMLAGHSPDAMHLDR